MVRDALNVFLEAPSAGVDAHASIKVVTDPEYAESGKVLLSATNGYGDVVSFYLDATAAQAFAFAVLRAAKN